RAQLAPRLGNEGAFLGGEDVIRIDYPLRLDEHAIRLLPKRHKIALADIEPFRELARDHHLPALTYASNPLVSCDYFHGHAFRLSDNQKMSRVFHIARTRMPEIPVVECPHIIVVIPAFGRYRCGVGHS